MPAIAGNWPSVAVVPGSGGFSMQVERVLDVGGRHLLAVVELDALPEFQTIRFGLTTS